MQLYTIYLYTIIYNLFTYNYIQFIYNYIQFIYIQYI